MIGVGGYVIKLFQEVIAWISSIFIGMASAFLISNYVIQPTKVIGQSMEPTLAHNSQIYISKLPYTFTYQPNYGDIVVIDSRTHRPRTILDDWLDSPFYSFISGEQKQVIWIKRVIGKPHDVIEFKNNQVYRNGKRLMEPYLNQASTEYPDQTFVVPEGTIFVMGDNRNHSHDSREIGFIPIDHVLGVKIF